MLVALVADFPPVVAGLIGAGGVAAAISTACALILSAATLLARNVVQRGFSPGLDDTRTARVSQMLVPVVTALAVGLTFAFPEMLVNLLLFGYSFVTQLFPAVILGLFSRWPTRAGIGAGLFVGLVTVTLCQLGIVRPPWGLHAGFLGLLLNASAVGITSLLTRPVEAERLDRFARVLGAEEGS
jgi:SSS family solute:Na+ symporter